jgi:hypothetical protein
MTKDTLAEELRRLVRIAAAQFVERPEMLAELDERTDDELIELTCEEYAHRRLEGTELAQIIAEARGIGDFFAALESRRSH